tara:strand:- start:377 stop:628 length:252 start_codon:yes stop_codon:yes gene_type:complete
MAKKKTVKISDVNKEIVEEMVEEQKAKEIADGIEIVKSINKLDDSVNSLLNITSMLDKRIDMLRDDFNKLELKVIKISGRMGL